MTYNPKLLTQFAFDTLSADSNVTALVTGIYSYALQDTQTPYLVIDLENARPLGGAGVSAMEVSFSVSCYSSEAGHAESFTIMEKVHTALQGKNATLTGYQIIHTRMTDSSHERLRDGKGIRSVLEFRSVMESI